MTKLEPVIAVYTICHNEEENVLAWLHQVKMADIIIVGDTGSTDRTTSLLEANGVIVHQLNIHPWRFDEARNQLLSLLPQHIDICISLDFDERLSSGWRANLVSVWNNEITRVRYRYTEKSASHPNDYSTIIASKIHSRHHYKWVYPVHELLCYEGPNQEIEQYATDIEILHLPNRARDRSKYLDLMILAVKEHPTDIRLVHQLGRDFLQSGMPKHCIEVMTYNMSLTDVPIEQHYACRRFIARAYGELQQYEQASYYLQQLWVDNPSCSSTYIEHAILSYKYQDWDDLYLLSMRCNQINFQSNTIYNEFHNKESLFFDLLSIACYHKSDFEHAIYYAKKALEKDPFNYRIRNNIKLFEQQLDQNNTK